MHAKKESTKCKFTSEASERVRVECNHSKVLSSPPEVGPFCNLCSDAIWNRKDCRRFGCHKEKRRVGRRVTWLPRACVHLGTGSRMSAVSSMFRGLRECTCCTCNVLAVSARPRVWRGSFLANTTLAYVWVAGRAAPTPFCPTAGCCVVIGEWRAVLWDCESLWENCCVLSLAQTLWSFSLQQQLAVSGNWALARMSTERWRECRLSAGENVCESVSPLKSGRSLARAAPNPLPWHNFRKSVPATFKVVDFESSRTWKRSQILEAAAQQHPIHVQFWRWGSKMTRNLSKYVCRQRKSFRKSLAGAIPRELNCSASDWAAKPKLSDSLSSVDNLKCSKPRRLREFVIRFQTYR